MADEIQNVTTEEEVQPSTPVADNEDDAMSDEVTTPFHLFGRREILTTEEKITKKNVIQVLRDAVAVHNQNSLEIDYLYQYMRGNQPILYRKKKIRPEICNRIVENHAAEITQFTSGYFLGEPLTYVRRGDNAETSAEIGKLNDYMFFEDKASHDKELATWMAVCGIGYRMVLPDRDAVEEADESPFELDTPDPRTTFVVYHSGFGHKRLMGVRQIILKNGDATIRTIYAVYTDKMYYEIENDRIIKERPHLIGDIPIYEYRLNMARMGSFEAAIPLLDGINTIMSNRVDGVEQFIQSFLKFKNCDIEDTTVGDLQKKGAIVIKSNQGLDADVEIVSQELNQEQTQTLVDYLYDQVLVICGLPTTTKGGASTSDTGAAVFLRDGWSQCEARAKDTELLFKKSEKLFLRTVLHLIRETHDFNLSLAEVECKFTRRQHDNLLVKTQALQNMLQSGLHPETAIATSGLFNDPMDVYLQSKEYLKKWEYRDPLKEMPDDDGGEDE